MNENYMVWDEWGTGRREKPLKITLAYSLLYVVRCPGLDQIGLFEEHSSPLLSLPLRLCKDLLA